MSDVYLTRFDPAKNMARYYVMSLQPTLFGEWSVVREWGRIGRGGQVKAVPYPSEADAAAAMGAIKAQKTKKGYYRSAGSATAL